jgi:hypothetical protein
VPGFFVLRGGVLPHDSGPRRTRHCVSGVFNKKQGAAGITTAAPRIAGQWGRGDNRLPELRTGPKVVPAPDKYF